MNNRWAEGYGRSISKKRDDGSRACAKEEYRGEGRLGGKGGEWPLGTLTRERVAKLAAIAAIEGSMHPGRRMAASPRTPERPDHMSSQSSPHLVRIWTQSGPDLIPCRFQSSRDLVAMWSRSGRDLVPMWSRFGLCSVLCGWPVAIPPPPHPPPDLPPRGFIVASHHGIKQ